MRSYLVPLKNVALFFIIFQSAIAFSQNVMLDGGNVANDFIYENGNVGVGKLNPVSKLDVFVAKDSEISGLNIGRNNENSGEIAIAIGTDLKSTGWGSFGLGYLSEATGNLSFASGYETKSTGYASYSFGWGAQSTGNYAFSVGESAKASGDVATAFGKYTKAESRSAFALGQFNVGGGSSGWNLTDPLFEIGNGTSETNRSNALTVLKNGNVGIGTTTMNSKFNVLGQNSEFYSGTMENTMRMGRDVNQNFRFHVSDNHGYLDYNQDSDQNGSHVLWIRNISEGTSASNDIRMQTSGVDRLTVKSDGDVGIGTIAPESPLHIAKSGSYINFLKGGLTGQYSKAWINMHGKTGGAIQFTNQTTDDKSTIFSNDGRLALVAGTQLEFAVGGSFEHTFVMKENGSVGIGTADTFGYKLAVNGTIGAKEMIIEVENEWPDYVFDGDYELKSLEETATFIKDHHHLPEIPSAKEIEENGISVGEMNTLLLKKIEELTLHLIELKRENQEILNQSKTQQLQLNELSQVINGKQN